MRHVPRGHVIAGLLLFIVLPAAALTAQAQSRSPEIEDLEAQFLATKNREQRRELLADLRALARSSPAEDAGALNAAVSAMLPVADSVAQAEQLLEIGAVIARGQTAVAPSLPGDTEFLVDARRAAREARYPNGDVERLADIRIDHWLNDSLGGNWLASAHVQQVWRINSAQGAMSFSPRSVMYSGTSEMLSLVRARVLKGHGRELHAAVSPDRPVMDRGASMYFDARSRDLQFQQVEAGDVVEIEYYLLPAAAVNPWAGYYARLDLVRDAFPARLWRRVIIAPGTMKLYAVEHGLNPVAVRQKGAETTRIWEASATGAQRLEARSVEARASGPYLHISTIGSLEELGRWYSKLLEPGLKLDDNLLTAARQILTRNLTLVDKVQAVYDLVQRRTKYVAFEFGVHSYQPYAVSTVERRGFGDCKDKAAMMVALLRAVGVPAEFAMVRTPSAGEVASEAYSVQLFDHAMAFVPELNLYLDGTADGAALGEVLPKYRGAIALTLNARGNATRRIVPLSPTEPNRVAGEIQGQIDSDGKGDFASQ